MPFDDGHLLYFHIYLPKDGHQPDRIQTQQ